jgi:hypothetical protein
VLVDPSSPRWRNALARVAHDVYHLPGYTVVEATRAGGRPVAFWWRDGGDELLLPLMIRRLPGADGVDMASTYGYGGPATSPGMDATAWKQACEVLVDTLAGQGAVSCFVRLHPLLTNDRETMAERGVVVHHGDTVNIDLRRSEDELRAMVRQNHRRDIRAVRRRDCRVVVDEDWSRIGDFVEMYHQTMHRVGADPYYFFNRDYFDALRRELAGHVHLLVGEMDGLVITGGVFTEAGGTVGYHLGATRDGYLRHSPFKLVLDDVRDWARRRGNHSLHLGGGLGGQVDELLRFKLGFSDERHAFHTWRIVVDEDRYDALCRRLRPDLDPADRIGYFPAYRSPEVAQHA